MADHVTTQHREQDAAVRQFVRNVVLMLTIRHALLLSAGWAFIWGVAVLVLRVGWHTPRLPLLVGLAGFVLAGVAAFGCAWRRRPTADAVRAMLDGRNRCGGLLMEADGDVLGDWSSRLGRLNLPRLQWRGGRACTLMAAAALFVLGSFVVPEKFTSTTAASSLDISDNLQTLNDQVKTLEEERIIDEVRTEQFEEKLEQVRRDASGNDPVKTWEALDHLSRQVHNEASQAVEDALKQTERMTQAQTLAQALDEDGDQLGAERFSEAMQTLSQLMSEAAAENAGLQGALSSASIDTSKLTPEQLKALQDALKQAKGNLREQLKKLSEAQLCDVSKLGECDKLGESDGTGFCMALGESEGEMTVEDVLKAWGISRGRGDAALTFNRDESTADGMTLQDDVLPAATLAALKESQLVGLGSGAPQLETGAGPSASGALDNASAGGGGAVTQTILPRHRGAVQRYFDRDSNASSQGTGN